MSAGEEYEASALRELEEEMGIKEVMLTPLGTFKFEDSVSKVITAYHSLNCEHISCVYACMCAGLGRWLLLQV